MNVLEDTLRDHRLRATPQRVAVLEAVMASDHPDAETVYAVARGHLKSMSLATVYHVLDKLSEVGLVSVLDFAGRRLYDGRVNDHDHVRCRGCGRVDDVDRDGGTRIVVPEGHGWRMHQASLLWEGLCTECQGRMAP